MLLDSCGIDRYIAFTNFAIVAKQLSFLNAAGDFLSFNSLSVSMSKPFCAVQLKLNPIRAASPISKKQ